jgi:hypothetical protein
MSPSLRKLLLLVGLGCGLAGILLLGRTAASRRPDARAAHAVDEDQSTAEAVQAAAPRAYERPPAVAWAPPPAPAAPPPAPAAGPAEMTPQQEAAQLNDAFAADPPADEAAANQRVAIATAFRAPAARGAALREIDCRATRCRMTVEFSDAGADKRVLSDLFKLLASAGVESQALGFTVPTREERSDGSIVATIHLYRADVGL